MTFLLSLCLPNTTIIFWARRWSLIKLIIASLSVKVLSIIVEDAWWDMLLNEVRTIRNCKKNEGGDSQNGGANSSYLYIYIYRGNYGFSIWRRRCVPNRVQHDRTMWETWLGTPSSREQYHLQWKLLMLSSWLLCWQGKEVYILKFRASLDLGL